MRHYSFMPLWILLLLASGFAELAAQNASTSNEAAFQAHRNAWVQALKATDLNAATKFLATDFTAILDAGQPMSRAAFIAALRSDRYDARDFGFEALPSQLRRYDGATIVAGKGIRSVTAEEQAFVREVRRSTGRSFLRETTIESAEKHTFQFTEIWAWHQERWQLIHLQWTVGRAQ